MNIIIRYLTVITLTIYTGTVFGQLIDNEQPHSSVKWEQINRPNFQLIFPHEFRNTASLLAHKIDSMLIFASQDLGKKPKKVSIILHENHIEQNGFAQLAPRKVEAFSTPGPASDNQEWLPNLIQHELRHVAQFDKLTGRMSAPFLEQLELAFYGIHLPAWYFEGDAVSIETQFSSGGRGRLPSFLMPLRTNEMTDKSYTFDKNILGSFQDITPSYYLTGYLMNTYLTNHFGYPVKEQIMEDMRKHLLRPYNFNRALRKATNMNSHDLYKATISELKSTWKDSENLPSQAEIRPNNERYFSHLFLPQSDGSDATYYLFQSPQEVSQLREWRAGKEKTLLKIGYQLTPYFHQSGDFIVWDEIRKDGRFGKQTYNIIRLYNIKTGRSESISRNSRLYSPIIDAEKGAIYAVQVDQNNVASLVYIDIISREQSKIIDFPTGILIQQPSLREKKDKIVAIAVSEKGTNLMEIDLQTKATSLVFPWSNQQFERPIYAGDDLIFKAHFDQIDNIYRYSKAENKTYRLSNSAFGAFYPSLASDGNLLYNEYQNDGYRLAKLELTNENRMEIQPVFEAPATTDKQISGAFSNSLAVEDGDFEVKKYNTLSDFFNFHSLSISDNNFEDFDNYKPGIFWLANDLMNTSQLKLGYEYDMDLEKSFYTAELVYQKYYPKFIAKYQNRGRIGYAKSSNPNAETVQFDYRDHYYSLEMQLPFSLYRGNNIYSFGINVGTSYQKNYDLSINNLKNFNEEIVLPMNYIAYFNRNARRSNMDLVPRWGQNISLIYRHLPFEKELNGNLFAIKSNFFFPGFFSNHAFQARFNYQNNTGRFDNSYEIPMISAFGHFKSGKVSNNLMLNYRFPIAYPDWTIGSLAYIKRFHGYFFADYQNLHDSDIAPKTYGIGLSVDLNIFRYKLPDIGIGSKLSYINDASAKNKIVPSFSFSYSY